MDKIDGKRIMDKLIGEIEKNSKEKIIVSINEFKGKTFLDLRVHFEEEKSGEYKPTKKGISISAKNIDGIINLLVLGKERINK